MSPKAWIISSLFLYIEAQVDNPNYKSRTEPAGNLIIKLLFEFTFIALSSTFHSPLKRTSKVDNEPGIHRVIKTNGSTFEKWIKTIWQNCSRKAAFFSTNLISSKTALSQNCTKFIENVLYVERYAMRIFCVWNVVLKPSFFYTWKSSLSVLSF